MESKAHFVPFIRPRKVQYSGLFSKQKFLQERQNLNFEELNFQTLQNSKILCISSVFEFKSKMAFTISSIVRGYHVYKDI